MMNGLPNEPAKRAAYSSPGWSERSEAEPWVTTSPILIARFRGRQNCSRGIIRRPLKRAYIFFPSPYPGLRCACPGLNSAAGYAGSSSDFVFNSAFQPAFLIVLGLIPEGGYGSCLT